MIFGLSDPPPPPPHRWPHLSQSLQLAQRARSQVQQRQLELQQRHDQAVREQVVAIRVSLDAHHDDGVDASDSASGDQASVSASASASASVAAENAAAVASASAAGAASSSGSASGASPGVSAARVSSAASESAAVAAEEYELFGDRLVLTGRAAHALASEVCRVQRKQEAERWKSMTSIIFKRD